MEGKRCMHILSKFRECEDPDLGSYEGEHLVTINRESLLKIAEKRELSLLSICRLGGIDPSRENICKLLQFDIDLKCDDEQAGPSVVKKTKVGSNMMTKLEEKIAALERQVQEKTKADQPSEVDRAKRDAKEEATKGDTCNIEVLHEKLILLENAARKSDNDNKDRYTMILSRFHVNKAKPSFAAALVLKLLSSKEEELILDKELKLKKYFESQLAHPHVPGASLPHWSLPVLPSPSLVPPTPPMPWSSLPPTPVRGPPSPYASRPRPRFSSAGRQLALCYRCRKPG